MHRAPPDSKSEENEKSNIELPIFPPSMFQAIKISPTYSNSFYH